ncbi:hypothetical protein [Clostridium brassicae]|uniref:DUF4064 domain-containing protein n=1 Tax=Clostridium brassicae TaxID=2999072 RepID=A0ABT4DC34_9CLOT|nr:hypothetical protein [Clostridium brassicae]MCY6959852.1 hypothetical protein [Clostridium brassicae]
MKKSKALIISSILGIIYSIYLVIHFGGSVLGANSGSEAVGGAIATALVAPHMICVILAAIFNTIGAIFNKSGFALVGAILYCVGGVLFIMYIIFVIPMIILSFVGYGSVKKRLA